RLLVFIGLPVSSSVDLASGTPGFGVGALVRGVLIPHRVLTMLTGLGLPARAGCCLLVQDQRALVPAYAARECFDTVVVGEGVPVGGNVGYLEEQAALDAFVHAVLLVPPLVGFKDAGV